jgi:hypothetical protein
LGIRILQQVPNQVAANEAATACNENFFHPLVE